MRLPLRETGSILVHAPRARVFELLQRDLATQPAPLHATQDERLEAAHAGLTYVLRDEPGGTRLFHARSRPTGLLAGQNPRDELRAAVQAELLRVQRMAQE